MDIQIPGICTTCGKLSFGFTFKGSSNVTVKNMFGDYACPHCDNGTAVIRSDIYNIINNIIDKVSQQPKERIEEIKKLLINSTSNTVINNINFVGVRDDIIDKAPELNSLKDLIPKTRNEAYAVITIIIAVIGIIANQLISDGKVDKQKVLIEIFPKQEILQMPNAPNKSITLNLGRNDPCHCGSGKKYKHCHGIGK